MAVAAGSTAGASSRPQFSSHRPISCRVLLSFSLSPSSFSFAVGSINLARTLRSFSFDQILPQGSGGYALSVFFASIFFEPFRRLIGLLTFLVAMSVVAPFTANYWLAVFLVRGCECKAGAVWPECSCVRRSVAFSG